jgi:hypothetical protein
MNSGRAMLIATLIGIACGLVCTYPAELGPTPSIIIWAIGGALVGFIAGRSSVIASGVVYGIVLTFVFLFSRFGGSHDKIPKYLLFVAAMSIAGAAGGIIAVFAGSRLRKAIGS